MPSIFTQTLLDYAELTELASKHGDSFFVLNGKHFATNFKALHKAFAEPYGPVKIGYSYKTNYTPQLCKIVNDLGGMAEVVSEMEYAHAKKLGVPGDRIIFNGPVKAEWAFAEAALAGATLNLDSQRDMSMLAALARDTPDAVINVVIRTNFAIGREISRFGMDVDGAEFREALGVITQLKNVHLKGLHCHFPDRDLDSFKRRAEGLVTLARQVFPDAPPEILNIGGGYFSNMPETLRARFNVPPATFSDYGQAVAQVLNKGFDQGQKPTLFLEPGTAIVADTQGFYTKVLSVKEVRGKRFATVSGSGFDISPTARSRHLPVTPILAEDREGAEAHDIVGFTCIENDILSENVVAPLQPGDWLHYGNVGSYSVVMRPPFILPASPVLFDEGEGNLTVIKRKQTNENVFLDFTY